LTSTSGSRGRQENRRHPKAGLRDPESLADEPLLSGEGARPAIQSLGGTGSRNATGDDVVTVDWVGVAGDALRDQVQVLDEVRFRLDDPW
jgi:hypothetical protein